AILAVCLLGGCSRTEAERETPSPDSPPAGRAQGVPVVMSSVVVKAMPVTIDAVGTAEAISTVQIRSQITGQLQEILFKPGQDVRKGQPLFVLDRRPLEAALRQAQAIVAKDEAQLKDAEAQRQRNQDLFNKGILARSDYEASLASAASLEATLAADRAQ